MHPTPPHHPSVPPQSQLLPSRQQQDGLNPNQDPNNTNPNQAIQASRYFDLLTQLKHEYDLVVAENKTLRVYRDDIQRNAEHQLAEMSSLDSALVELERKHQITKEQYDAEIARLTAATQSNQQSNEPSAAAAAAVSAATLAVKSTPIPLPSSHHTLPLPSSVPISHDTKTTNPSMTAARIPSIPSTTPHTLNRSTPMISDNPYSSNNPHPFSSQPDSIPSKLAPPQPHQSNQQHQQPQALRLGMMNGGPDMGSASHRLKFPGVGAMTEPSNVPLPSPGTLGLPVAANPPPPGIPTMMSAGIPNGGGVLTQNKLHTPLNHLGNGPPQPQPQPSQQDMMQHPSGYKKEHSLSMAAPGLRSMSNQMLTNPINSHTSINRSFPQHRPLGGTDVGGPPHQPPQPGHHPQPMSTDDDWTVMSGRSNSGVAITTKVSLENSLIHNSVVCCVRYSWDGQYLATGSNQSAHIYDAKSGTKIATFPKDPGNEPGDANGNDSYVRAVCFSPDGNWLITGAEDHVVKVWDVRNRTVKHVLQGHTNDIYSVDASSNGQFIISGSGDKKAKLWNLETGQLRSTLGGEQGPTDGITSVSVSPTSQHVAAGSLDKIVRVWDAETGRLVRHFEGHRDSVYSVAFSPDGRLLLSGSLDKTLKLWDLSASQPSNECRMSFSGHQDFVLSVAFSPNSKWLISGSKDRTVQFWDPRQNESCITLQGHKNSVISIAHNPQKTLATGSGDCRARTWTYT